MWNADPPHPDDTPLADPESYRLPTPLSAAELHGTPHEILEHESEQARDPQVREQYRRVSADVTMRGETTSGVVYPLAIGPASAAVPPS